MRACVCVCVHVNKCGHACYVCVYLHVCCMYWYAHVCVCVYVREREREREGGSVYSILLKSSYPIPAVLQSPNPQHTMPINTFWSMNFRNHAPSKFALNKQLLFYNTNTQVFPPLEHAVIAKQVPVVRYLMMIPLLHKPLLKEPKQTMDEDWTDVKTEIKKWMNKWDKRLPQTVKANCLP